MDTLTVFREHAQAEREILASQLNEHQASTFTRIKGEGVLESSPGEGTLVGMSVRVGWGCLVPGGVSILPVGA